MMMDRMSMGVAGMLVGVNSLFVGVAGDGMWGIIAGQIDDVVERRRKISTNCLGSLTGCWRLSSRQ